MIKKVVNSLKRDGIFLTLKKIFRAIKYKLLAKQQRNILNQFINVNEFENIIVFENNFGWNKIMKQRPQQIAEGLPANTLMFYHSNIDEDFKNQKVRINRIKNNIVLIDLGYFRNALFEELANITNKYLMIYSTDFIPYDRIKLYKNNGYEIIYEYVDEFNEELSGKETFELLSERHNNLLKDEPIVICTATELYNNCINSNFNHVKLITNGVDYEHFKPSEYEIPEDMKEIRKNYKYIICYYGALASWFDYDLVKKLANKNKDYAIMLLGQDYDKTLDKSGIKKYKNIFYLGKKNYNDLPAYGMHSDIFTIPFILNDITKATSPVKIFEYMAMEKPIVTTALPECKKYKSVLYSENQNEFIDNIEKAVKLFEDKKYKKLLLKEAKENTWTTKANDLIEFAIESKKAKYEGAIKKVFNESKYDRIIVWRSPFGWNVPLFQRPQHIARQLANKKNLVLYEITSKTDDVGTIKKQEENLYLVNFENPTISKLLKEELKKRKENKYLQIYSTNWSMGMAELNEYIDDGFKLLYEYIDDISPDLAGTDEIPTSVMDKYNYAMENKDVLVVTTARELYKDVESKRGTEKMVFSCNGVDYDFFQDIDKNFEFEQEFLDIINNGKINLCYYGALATWFDYELIKKINKEDKFNIILFGVRYDNSLEKSKIENLENVHFMGPRDYKVLKNYASKMDILTIPFIINSITQATSPLKLFEYMALHKPIVTSAMNECKNYESVMTAETHEEFIEKLYDCSKLSKDKKYLKLLDKEAHENDWSHKADLIIDMLEQNEGGK